MNLQQLKYIVELNRVQHFAKAAEICNVSQPALTIQLKKLEEEIGIRIFDRTKSPVEPTTLGKALIEKAEKILKQVEDIRTFIIDKKDVLEGKVIVGIIPTLSPYLIPICLRSLQNALPKVKFHIREASTVYLVKELENGNIDVAVMATPTGNKLLREFPVFNEKFVSIIHPESTLHNSPHIEINDEFKKELLLLRDEYCYNSQLLDICQIKQTNPNKDFLKYDITSIETLKNLAKQNFGYAIVPELSVDNNTDSNYLMPFPSPQPSREISLVVHENYHKKQIVEKMNKVIHDSLPSFITDDSPLRKIRWDDSPYFRKMIGH